jgi:hypothetical protein
MPAVLWATLLLLSFVYAVSGFYKVSRHGVSETPTQQVPKVEHPTSIHSHTFPKILAEQIRGRVSLAKRFGRVVL